MRLLAKFFIIGALLLATQPAYAVHDCTQDLSTDRGRLEQENIDNAQIDRDSGLPDPHDCAPVSSTGSIPTVTSPNGGESFNAGSFVNITWGTTSATGFVKIEYSIDGFVSSAVDIITSTPNDGVFPWVVADISSDTVMIRISDASNSANSDVSNSVFSIVGGSTTDPDDGDAPPPPPEINIDIMVEISDAIEKLLRGDIDGVLTDIEDILDVFHGENTDLLGELLEEIRKSDPRVKSLTLIQLQRFELAKIEAAREDVNKLIFETLKELNPKLVGQEFEDPVTAAALLVANGYTNISPDPRCDSNLKVNGQCTMIKKEGRIVTNTDDYLFEEPLQKARDYLYCELSPWKHYPLGDDWHEGVILGVCPSNVPGNTKGILADNPTQDCTIGDRSRKGDGECIHVCSTINICSMINGLEASELESVANKTIVNIDTVKRASLRSQYIKESLNPDDADVVIDAWIKDVENSRDILSVKYPDGVDNTLRTINGRVVCESDVIRDQIKEHFLASLTRKTSGLVVAPPETWYTKDRCDLIEEELGRGSGKSSLETNNLSSVISAAKIPDLRMSLSALRGDVSLKDYSKAGDTKNTVYGLIGRLNEISQSIISNFQAIRTAQFVAGQGIRPATLQIGFRDDTVPEELWQYFVDTPIKNAESFGSIVKPQSAWFATNSNLGSKTEDITDRPLLDRLLTYHVFFVKTENITSPSIVLLNKLQASIQAQFDLAGQGYKLEPDAEHVIDGSGTGPNAGEICPSGIVIRNGVPECKNSILNGSFAITEGKLPAPFEDEASYLDLSKISGGQYLQPADGEGNRVPSKLFEYLNGGLTQVFPHNQVFGLQTAPDNSVLVPGGSVYGNRNGQFINSFYTNVVQLYEKPFQEIMKDWFTPELEIEHGSNSEHYNEIVNGCRRVNSIAFITKELRIDACNKTVVNSNKICYWDKHMGSTGSCELRVGIDNEPEKGNVEFDPPFSKYEAAR